MTVTERQRSRAFDVLASKLTGYKTEDQKKAALRYNENKEARKLYYEQHKQERKEYYQRNRERLKARALKRYYEKLKEYP